MNQLVFIQNEQVVTDSLLVAEKFDRNHNHVLRDIRNMECSNGFSLSNFGQSTYKAHNGQEYSKVNMTRDGFTFLVMGYTGKEAAKFKEDYINAFNIMELQLKQLAVPSYTIDDPVKRAEKWITEYKEKQLLEQELNIAAPKIALYDTAMNAKNNQPMGSVAKSLGVGHNKLFQILRDQKILMRNNMPYQRYIEQGYFDVRQYTITHMTQGLENKTQTLVTPKGMAYIHRVLEEKSA